MHGKIDVDLEIKCWACNETGLEDRGVGGLVSCHVCGGSGKLLTDHGRELLDFLKRHLVDPGLIV